MNALTGHQSQVGRDCPRAAAPGSVLWEHTGSRSPEHTHVQRTPVLATLGLATKWLTEHVSSPPALVTTNKLWRWQRHCGQGDAVYQPVHHPRGQFNRAGRARADVEVGDKGLGHPPWNRSSLKPSSRNILKPGSTTQPGWQKVSVSVDV